MSCENATRKKDADGEFTGEDLTNDEMEQLFGKCVYGPLLKFRLRTISDNYMGETRPRTRIVGVDKINFSTRATEMLAQIGKMHAA